MRGTNIIIRDSGSLQHMQSPTPGALNIDHVAHFVPQREACHEALIRLGFSPTPFSLQQHRVAPDAPLAPVGTGNHCVMLEHGYLEFLVPMAETDVATQLRRAIGRYVGVHSIVFGTADPQADQERLRREGFMPQAPIDLQRPIETSTGQTQTVRFTVVRVPPGAMPEGRIQFCQHHTEALVWQPRWLAHANGAVALAGVFVCTDDPDEACARYGRFTGLPVRAAAQGGRMLQTQRGWVTFYDPAQLLQRLGAVPPAVPAIAGCELHSRDLGLTQRLLASRGFALRSLDAGRIALTAPPAIGAELVFAASP
jgi:hypothetical protein